MDRIDTMYNILFFLFLVNIFFMFTSFCLLCCLYSCGAIFAKGIWYKNGTAGATVWRIVYSTKRKHPTMPFLRLVLVQHKIYVEFTLIIKLLHLLLYTILRFCAEKNRCKIYNDSLSFLERVELLTEPATISIMVAGSNLSRKSL